MLRVYNSEKKAIVYMNMLDNQKLSNQQSYLLQRYIINNHFFFAN